METKVQKTILGKQVKKVQFYKMNVARLNQRKTFGFIWLADSNMRIRIEAGKIYMMNPDGKNIGVILKTSQTHRKIKRMIAIWFRNYRKPSLNNHLAA